MKYFKSESEDKNEVYLTLKFLEQFKIENLFWKNLNKDNISKKYFRLWKTKNRK